MNQGKGDLFMNRRNLGGATIHVVFYILEKYGVLHKCFDPTFIVNTYKELLNSDPIVMTIISKCKKHHRSSEIKALEDPSSARRWFRLHCCRKSRCYFEPCSERGKFRLREEFISLLREESRICREL